MGHVNLGAVGKAVVILDVVAGASRPLSLSDIARRGGLPKATVHRLLATLEQHGLLCRGPQGYRLGDKPLQWPSRVTSPSTVDLRWRAMPYLVELHHSSRLATVLTLLTEDQVVPLERIYDRHQLAEIAPLTDRSPAHCTATGKVLLAFDPRAAERVLARGTLQRYTDRTITSGIELTAELARIRDEGVGWVNGEYSDRLWGLAVPVASPTQRVIAAIGVAGPAGKVGHPQVIRALRTAGAELSRALRTRSG